MFKPASGGSTGYGAKMGGQSYPAGATKPSNTVPSKGQVAGGKIQGPGKGGSMGKGT